MSNKLDKIFLLCYIIFPKGRGNMKREEILEKIKKENNDEREKEVKFNSNYYGLLMLDIVFVIIWISDEIKSLQNNTVSKIGDIVMPLLFAQCLGEFIYKYFKNGRKKSDLIWTIILSILLVLSLVYFYMYAF